MCCVCCDGVTTGDGGAIVGVVCCGITTEDDGRSFADAVGILFWTVGPTDTVSGGSVADFGEEAVAGVGSRAEVVSKTAVGMVVVAGSALEKGAMIVGLCRTYGGSYALEATLSIPQLLQ